MVKSGSTKYIPAVDLGTSGCKTALISTYGEIIGFEFHEIALHIFEGGCAEQDPHDWWDAFISSSKKILGEKLVPIDQEGHVYIGTSSWLTCHVY